jgi:hypothetical protein
MKYKNIGLQKRWGESIRNPGNKDLKSALFEMEKKDPEHTAAWIEDESGNVLEVRENYSMFFYNFNDPGKTAQIRCKDINETLDIWLLLCSNQINELNKIFGKSPESL